MRSLIASDLVITGEGKVTEHKQSVKKKNVFKSRSLQLAQKAKVTKWYISLASNDLFRLLLTP